jgi:hypothetical protein
LTKETSASVRKTSETMRKRGIDNFSTWRKQARIEGKIPLRYTPFEKNESLAFLIGMVLGDGHICSFPRTECLRISLGTDKPELWKYTAQIVEDVFRKRPSVRKVTNAECMTITLYQKEISKRLGVPIGSRKSIVFVVPRWIRGGDRYTHNFLRGLYEAEGSLCVHHGTYTHKMIFVNTNESLLSIVFALVKELGFSPHRSKNIVQISKKEEVYRFRDLIKFRRY